MGDLWEEAGELAKEVDKGDKPLVDMTSGYFAFSEEYKTAVLDSEVDVRIVAASPKVRRFPTGYVLLADLSLISRTYFSLILQANGFYGSKGISGLIPDGYTMLERDFERETRRRGRDWKDPASFSSSAVGEKGERTGGVEISEWERPGWTYHAKGEFLSRRVFFPSFFTFYTSYSLKLNAHPSFSSLRYLALPLLHLLPNPHPHRILQPLLPFLKPRRRNVLRHLHFLPDPPK